MAFDDEWYEDIDPELERRWLERVLRDDRQHHRIQLDELRTGNPASWARIAIAMQHEGSFDRVERIQQGVEDIMGNLRLVVALYRKYGRTIVERRVRMIEDYFREYGQELDDLIASKAHAERPPRDVVDEFLASLRPGGADPASP